MGVIEIVVIIISAAIVAAVIGLIIWRKVKGKKPDCGCGCGSSCPHCSGCSSKPDKKKK